VEHGRIFNDGWTREGFLMTDETWKVFYDGWNIDTFL
jgi:hypothetical protein